MKFGVWIKELRLKQQLRGKDLAARSGVDVGTVSRIELGRTDTTMSTAVRLCRGLGVDFTAFYEIAQDNTAMLLPVPRVDVEWYNALLQPEDVIDFIQLFRNYSQDGARIVAKLINLAASLQIEQNIPREVKKTQDIQLASVNVEEIVKNMSLRELNIPYPVDISTEELCITAALGAIIPEDIRVYLKKLRLEQNLTLAELAQAFSDGPSASTLSRLENGTIEQLTLTEVLKLGHYYGQKGTALVSMCWQLGRLEADEARRYISVHLDGRLMPPSSWTQEEIEIAYVFVKTYRWCQYLLGKKLWFAEWKQEREKHTS